MNHDRGVGAVWFTAGLVLALLIMSLDARADTASHGAPSIRVRSSCPAGVAVIVSTGHGQERFTLREPGLYRWDIIDDADTRLRSTREERRLAELQRGAADEILIPATWCPATRATAPGVGLIGP